MPEPRPFLLPEAGPHRRARLNQPDARDPQPFDQPDGADRQTL